MRPRLGQHTQTLTPRAAASRGQRPRIAPAARAPPPAGSGGPGAGPGPAYACRAGDVPGLQTLRSRVGLSEAGGAGGRCGARVVGSRTGGASCSTSSSCSGGGGGGLGEINKSGLSFGSALAAILSRTSERRESGTEEGRRHLRVAGVRAI